MSAGFSNSKRKKVLIPKIQILVATLKRALENVKNFWKKKNIVQQPFNFTCFD